MGTSHLYVCVCIYVHVCVCVCVCVCVWVGCLSVCVDLKKAVTVSPSEGLLSSSPGQRSVTLTVLFVARFVEKLMANLLCIK